MALHAIILLYSLSAVCSKMAAGCEPFSLPFIAWYAGMLLLLGVSALVWQQVIKSLPLTTAFANKGVTVAWGLLWGALLFGESIDLKMLIGAAIVFVGIIVVVYADA
ncbi:MAG: transporter [Coriobacteriales bacterium]|nr:transporter [Coriobacteriales bacterium]